MRVVGMIGEHKTRYRLCWIIRGSQGWVKDLDGEAMERGRSNGETHKDYNNG